MALVRISKDLHASVEEEITSFANKIYKEQIATLCPEASSLDVYDPEFATLCENLLWGEHAHLKDVMPTKWCVEPEKIDANFRLGDSRLMLFVRGVNGRKFKAPPKTSQWSPDVYIEEKHFDMVPWVRGFLTKRDEFEKAKTEHTNKFNGIKAQVRMFLNGCKSLNDAVKKWPDIKLWIPQRFLTELDRVVERTTRAAKEKEEADAAVAMLDTNLITSLGVMKAIQAA